MRTVLRAVMRHFMQAGRLSVRFPDGRVEQFGNGDGPAVGVAVADWRTAFRLLTNPALEFGEAYVDGRLAPIDCTLDDLLGLLFLNLMRGGRHPGLEARRALARLGQRVAAGNDPAQARREVRHHYDLNGRLYSLFLDRDQQYSCAYFERGDETLEEAQAAKKRLIARKLLLDRQDLRVLDIGCGWGGLAMTLARDHGALVTGITLSTEQAEAARARVQAAGLADRVTIELRDWREMAGSFDRVVSVGMFEHVGRANYPAYFRALRGLLAARGVALIHAIGRWDGPSVTNPWISRYIFPGGYSPALSEVLAGVEQSGLIPTDIEILRLHYAETLRHWRRRFAANRDTIAALYDERFCRMFELYLTGSEMTFRRLGHMVWQLQLARSHDAVPLTRDYLLEDAPVKLPHRELPPTLSRDMS